MADPDLAALRDGGTLLELGCGVAGRTLALLQGVPDLRVVGLELAEDLAAEARSRAEALGVADRFEVVLADATTFDRPGAFDVVFWSQFFFPAASRRAALGVAFASLRPSGIVQAPLAGDFPTMRAEPDGGQARYYAVSRVVYESWGVPERTPEQLAAELEEAGFVDVDVRGGGTAGPQRARGVRP
jgi:trans-aconitate methyltransferase